MTANQNSWQSKLLTIITQLKWGPSKPLESAVQSFSSPLELAFIQGVQSEKKVILAYGPRTAGLHHWDIELEEPGCPPESFTITPKGGAAEFYTKHPQMIKVNGSSRNSHILQEGDVISIGTSQIRIGIL